MQTLSLKLGAEINLEIELLHIMMAKSPKNQKTFGPFNMPYYMFSYIFQSEYHVHGENWDRLIKEREAVFLKEGETITTTYLQKQEVSAVQIIFKIHNKQNNLDEILPRFINLTDNRNVLESSIMHCLNAYKNQHFLLAKEEFMTIFIEFLKIRSRQKIAKYSPHIQSAIKYITEHFIHQPSREEIAAYCQLNPMYLSTLFSKETGQNMKTYINQKRILHAKELISETGDTISEIADKLEMDIFSFSRLFKKLSGLSPSNYAKIYRI